MEVGLVLSPLNNVERKIIEVATFSMRYICLDVEGVHQLGLLAKVLLEKVRELSKQYEKKVLEKTQNIPIDDLYKRARPRLIALDAESANKSRRWLS